MGNETLKQGIGNEEGWGQGLVMVECKEWILIREGKELDKWECWVSIWITGKVEID